MEVYKKKIPMVTCLEDDGLFDLRSYWFFFHDPPPLKKKPVTS